MLTLTLRSASSQACSSASVMSRLGATRARRPSSCGASFGFRTAAGPARGHFAGLPPPDQSLVNIGDADLETVARPHKRQSPHQLPQSHAHAEVLRIWLAQLQQPPCRIPTRRLEIHKSSTARKPPIPSTKTNALSLSLPRRRSRTSSATPPRRRSVLRAAGDKTVATISRTMSKGGVNAAVDETSVDLTPRRADADLSSRPWVARWLGQW